MNELINELAKQADIKFSAHWQHQGVDTAVIIPSDLEKFAQSIVRECAGLCEREGDNPFNNVWEQTRAKCDALMIIKHFGVEE